MRCSYLSEIQSEDSWSFQTQHQKYDLHCDYRYFYVSRNYLFYRIEKDRINIVEMFDEREGFMYKLFGISSISQESSDY